MGRSRANTLMTELSTVPRALHNNRRIFRYPVYRPDGPQSVPNRALAAYLSDYLARNSDKRKLLAKEETGLGLRAFEFATTFLTCRSFLLLVAVVGSPVPWIWISVTTTLFYTAHCAYLAVANKTLFHRIKDAYANYQQKKEAKENGAEPIDKEAFLKCAKTKERLEWPVTFSDGYTYKFTVANTILSAENPVSPVTGEYLSPTIKIPNHALRNLMYGDANAGGNPEWNKLTTVDVEEQRIPHLHLGKNARTYEVLTFGFAAFLTITSFFVPLVAPAAFAGLHALANTELMLMALQEVLLLVTTLGLMQAMHGEKTCLEHTQQIHNRWALRLNNWSTKHHLAERAGTAKRGLSTSFAAITRGTGLRSEAAPGSTPKHKPSLYSFGLLFKGLKKRGKKALGRIRRLNLPGMGGFTRSSGRPPTP